MCAAETVELVVVIANRPAVNWLLRTCEAVALNLGGRAGVQAITKAFIPLET